jgi:hypothetical protein
MALTLDLLLCGPNANLRRFFSLVAVVQVDENLLGSSRYFYSQ